MKDKLKRLFLRFFRFANVGVFVTLLSLSLSFLFLKIIGTPLLPTYVILYISMIFISYILNSFYTFKAKRTTKNLILYFVSYGLSMLLGVALLALFRRYLPFENWILAYLVIPFTMSSNFILSSYYHSI
mgnify:FL=1